MASLLTLGLVASASAYADPPRLVRLEYERQAGATACPDDAAIRAGVAARLGYEPFSDRADERLRATIRPAGNALEARIELRDAQDRVKAERRLVSRNHDCAELASSIELAIAIAIDPVGSAPPRAGADGSAPTTTGNAEQGESRHDMGVPAEPPAASAGEVTAPLALLLEAALLGGMGSAPSASLGLRAGAALRREALSLGVEARADLPASSSLRAGEASASLLVASVVPCVHVRGAAACALVTGGVLRVAGTGLVDQRHATLPYLGFGARLAYALPITERAAVLFQGDVTAPVTRTKLTVSDSVVWTSDAAAFTLGVGVACRFP